MAKVFLYDEYNPEDTAMMQALYSRSAESVVVHAEKVKASGSGKFMERFYVGYGHQSIADCGSTTLFIEGISMLGAKAVQDWPLYAGQETSTRYIDMSQQAIADPLKSKASRAILKRWLDFYVASGPELEQFLREKYPIKAGEDEKVYGKAIKARSFDILRGFLPAGMTTQISWHTNLRQAWDKLSTLRHHPLEEVRGIAEKIWKQLKDRYPNSFSHKLYADQEAYRDAVSAEQTYFAPSKFSRRFSATASITKTLLRPYAKLLKERPVKTTLPFFMRSLGTYTFDFLLDFGSFRDLQRHRASIYQMPLLTTRFGFHAWYLDQLPKALRKKADKLIVQQTVAIQKLKTSEEDRQYYIAMGLQVPCRFTFDLPALVYFIELRSGRLVHPTLRPIAHAMHHTLQQDLPLVTLHTDLDPDDWDVRRGLQDIVKK
jgi:thymidylate synthase ThyX